MGNATYRDSTIVGDATLSTNTITSVAPTTQAGDGQIILVGASRVAPNAAPTVSTPSGWTQAAVSSAFVHAGTLLNSRLYVFTRKAVDADSDVPIVANANAAMFAVRVSYSGVDPNGFFGQAVFQDGASGTSHVVNSITTARANSLIGILLTQSVAQNSTPPSGMTEREDDAALGTTYVDAIQAAAGATGNKTFTASSAADFLSTFIELYSNNPVAAVDSLTFSDAAAAALDAVVAASDTVSLSDAAAVSAGFQSSAEDTVAFSDEADALLVFVGDAEDNISLSDSVVGDLIAGAVATDTIAFSDSVEVVLDGVGAAEDSLSMSDSVVGTSVFTGDAEDTLTFADAVVGVAGFLGELLDTMSLSDAAAVAAAFQGLATDSIALTDSAIAVEPGESSAFDQITITDEVVALLAAVGAAEDTITFLDSAVGTTPPMPPVFQFNGADPTPEDYKRDGRHRREELEKAIARFNKKADKAIEKLATPAQAPVAVAAKKEIVQKVLIDEMSIRNLEKQITANLQTVFNNLMAQAKVTEEEEVRKQEAIKARRRRDDEIMLLF